MTNPKENSSRGPTAKRWNFPALWCHRPRALTVGWYYSAARLAGNLVIWLALMATPCGICEWLVAQVGSTAEQVIATLGTSRRAIGSIAQFKLEMVRSARTDTHQQSRHRTVGKASRESPLRRADLGDAHRVFTWPDKTFQLEGAVRLCQAARRDPAGHWRQDDFGQQWLSLKDHAARHGRKAAVRQIGAKPTAGRPRYQGHNEDRNQGRA